MARYEHYLFPSKGDRYPTFVVGLHVQANDLRHSSGSGVCELELQKWDAVIYEKKEIGYVVKAKSQGASAIQFWEAIKNPCERGGECLVACYDAAQVWPLIGVWNALETGTAMLSAEIGYAEQNLPHMSNVQSPLGSMGGVDSIRSSGHELPKVRQTVPRGNHGNRQKRQWHSSVHQFCSPIIEDPPSIIWLKIPGLKGRMRWIDVKNYGIKWNKQSSSGSSSSVSIANLIVSIIELLKYNGMGSIKSTAASQSLFSFRRKYLSTSLLCHNNNSALQIEKDSYYGGRCECYRLGQVMGTIYALDFRSMYPYCYTSAALPCRILDYERCKPARTNIDLSMARNAIATVEIETDEAAYPAKRGGIIIYPVGRFVTTLCGPELYDAIKNGRVARIHSIATYDLDPCLREFGERLYAIRQDCELSAASELASFAKAMLNSVVGKFGQREKTWIRFPELDHEKEWGYLYHTQKTGELERTRWIAGICEKEIVGGYSNDAVPSISAWITSLGRVLLLNAIRCAGWRNTFYCDTDSLFVSTAGHNNLAREGWIGNGVIGKLQLKAVADGCTLFGIKRYRVGRELRNAGIPQSAQELPENRFVYSRFATANEQICKGHAPRGRRIEQCSVRMQDYHQGIKVSSGEIHPITLKEW